MAEVSEEKARKRLEKTLREKGYIHPETHSYLVDNPYKVVSRNTEDQKKPYVTDQTSVKQYTTTNEKDSYSIDDALSNTNDSVSMMIRRSILTTRRKGLQNVPRIPENLEAQSQDSQIPQIAHVPRGTIRNTQKEKKKDKRKYCPYERCRRKAHLMCNCKEFADLMCSNGHRWWTDSNGETHKGNPHDRQ